MTEIIENIESFNKDIVSWGHRTRQTILGKIPKGRHASGAKEEPLARSFRMNTSKTFGEIDRIGFLSACMAFSCKKESDGVIFPKTVSLCEANG